MATRALDPRALDVEAFADSAAQLNGSWPLQQLSRIVEAAHAETRPGAADAARWSARGERRRAGGAVSQVWLHLKAEAKVALECQRCLQPVDTALAAERSFLFVPGEDAAAELDADSEDDVLALTHALDLQQLIEDELLLSMPLVPRHDACALPLPGSAPEVEPVPPHPFAALATLKGKTRLN
jgi:uncharacterized protein